MLLTRPRRRQLRLALLLLTTLLLWAVVFVYKRNTTIHILQPALFHSSTTSSPGFISLPDDTAALCHAHGFNAYRQDAQRPRRVYDLFLLSTELDWLEIRLHTLAPHVDYFIIVESLTTFTGLPKPTHLADNWNRFAAFHPQIIHRVVEDPGASVGSRTWDHEDFFRNALFTHAFPSLMGTAQEAGEGDVLLVSDIDEVPKPETVTLLRLCDFPDRLTLRSHFYYYSFQWLHRGPQWPHPQATTFHGLASTILPKDLRNGEPGTPGFLFVHHLVAWWQRADLGDAAWHCSSCFATLAEMQTKMQSFSHSGWNTAGNRDARTIMERVRAGEDLFGRAGEVYERVEGNGNVPGYVLEQPGEFGYLVDRDGEGAGFRDWEEGV